MKYDRLALIAAAELALAEEKAHHEQRAVELAEVFQQAKRVWMATHGEEWQEALTRLRRQLREGKPIRESDLPADATKRGYRTTATFDMAPPRPVADYEPSRELTSFVRTLGTVVDDQVSSAALQEIGITRSALRIVVVKLAPNTIRT